MGGLSETIRCQLVTQGPMTIRSLRDRLATRGVHTTAGSLRQYLFAFRRLGVADIVGREPAWPRERGPQHIWRGIWGAVPGRETDAAWAANPRSWKRYVLQ